MATNLINRFVALRHRSLILRDEGGYNLLNGECNPVIFCDFIEKMMDSNFPSCVVWEPFAGHTSHNLEIANNVAGLKLISHDIAPIDSRIIRNDSTKNGPDKCPNGLFFHPPYFGGSSFSHEPGEVSCLTDWGKYLRLLSRTIFLANVHRGGLACAVGRIYRYGGSIVNLPEAFLEIFDENGYILIEVWSSEPDVVLILEKK